MMPNLLPSPSPAHDHQRAGFSLIEVLAVMVLLGLIAALVIPLTFGMIERQKERQLVRELAVAVSGMKLRALMEECPIEISLAGDRIEFRAGGRLLERFETGELTVVLPAAIVFNRNGYTAGGEIHLQGIKHYTIGISRLSGEIKVDT